MALEIQQQKKSVAVSGELNIYSAREAGDKLLPLLRDAAKPTLDLGQVAEFDSSGIQVLLMASREAEAAGKALVIASVSGPVREALDLVQCDELRARIRSAS